MAVLELKTLVLEGGCFANCSTATFLIEFILFFFKFCTFPSFAFHRLAAFVYF